MKNILAISLLLILISCSTGKTSIRENNLNGTGRLVNDMKQGKWIFFKNDTIDCIGFYKKNNKNGSWVYFYNNGKIHQQGNYVNDKQNGIWKYYFDSGEFMGKGLLVNNNQEGLWKWYHKNGTLYTERFYKDGKLVNIKSCFDKNGNPQNCGKISNGNGLLIAHDLFDETTAIEEIEFENGLVKE